MAVVQVVGGWQELEPIKGYPDNRVIDLVPVGTLDVLEPITK